MTGSDDVDRRKDACIHALEAQLAILKAQRDELLAALTRIVLVNDRGLGDAAGREALDAARAAIASVEGK